MKGNSAFCKNPTTMNAQQNQFRDALAVAYADLFANNPDYSYSASKTTPTLLADKMTASAIAGSLNKDGEGVRRACVACGIPHTLKAISAFVGYEKPVRAVAAKKVQTLVLAKIQTAMSGVTRIDRAHDLVTLEYVDGTREAGKIPQAKWDALAGETFAIISEVQSQRVKA
jgi:hypothetical protein